MAAASKNVYFDVLDGIVGKYNNTVHRAIKMIPFDVTTDSYAEQNEDSNEKDPKFKVGDRVRISKQKNIFAKAQTQNWSEEIFVVRKMKNTVPRTNSVSNYATKTDLKNVTHVDTSNFALKTNLASLKTEVNKLDTNKLVPVPVDLSKLSDVVKNEVVKKLYMKNQLQK